MSHGHQLLQILADGRFHSGEYLGRRLGISRAGVWKRLHLLKERGIDIHSVRGRGHRLAAPVELLSDERIRAALPAATGSRLPRIDVHFDLDSTNGALLERAAQLPTGTVCVAECQQHGRGRHGRRWISPCARNLYLSLLWRFPAGPDALGGLSLAVGLAVLRALESVGVRGAGIKWPNDIVWRDAKLAGVLIELSGESGGDACVVIGIGINVDMPEALGAAIDQPWTDVATILDDSPSRNLLAARVLTQQVALLVDYQNDGFAPLAAAWRRHDTLAGRPVALRSADREIRGIARGVDAGGALLIEHDGSVHSYRAGDVSLRPAAQPVAGTALT